MPDENGQPSTETPEAPPLEQPELKPPEDAAPGAAPEQEAPPEEKGEAGAEAEQEGEEDLAELLAELGESDPDLKQKLSEKWGLGPQPESASVVEAARQGHLQNVHGISQAYTQDQQERAQKIKTLVSKWNEETEKGVTDILRGHRPEDQKRLLAEADVTRDLAQVVVDGQNAQYEWTVAAMDYYFTDAMEEAAGGLLSSDQRKKLAEIDVSQAGADLQELAKQKVALFLEAAKASAPEAERKRVRAELEKELGSAEKLAKVKELLGKRKKATPQAAPAPETSHEARLQRLAYGRDANGTAPTQADREWLAAQN